MKYILFAVFLIMLSFACASKTRPTNLQELQDVRLAELMALDTMKIDYTDYEDVPSVAETAKQIGMPVKGSNGKIDWSDYYQRFLTVHHRADFNADGTLSTDEFIRYNAFVKQAKLLSELKDRIRLSRDIVYGETLHGKILDLDLYMPMDSILNPPLIVWVHGGGWRAGSKENCLLNWLAGDGYAVASINFSSTLDAPFPQNIQDIQEALRWLYSNSEEFGFSNEGFVLAGHSSGAHLAALVGLVNNNNDTSQVDIAGIIGLSGAYYIKKWADNPAALKIVLGVTSDTTDFDSLAEESSPYSHLDTNDPSILLMHSEHDEVVPAFHSIDMAAEAKAIGIKSELIVTPGRGHGFRFVTKKEREPVLTFLNRHLSF